MSFVMSEKPNQQVFAFFLFYSSLSVPYINPSKVMGIAFTAVPENFDVNHLILKRHQKLFDDGLDETYFDMVMSHFTDTLREMKVDPTVIDAAIEVIMPLREIFVQGAVEAKERRQQRQREEILAKVAVSTIGAGLLIVAWNVLKKSKHL